MTFSWNDPEVKSLVFAYTFFGLMVFVPLALNPLDPTICTFGSIDASLVEWPEPSLWERFGEMGINAGIGGLIGFTFIVSILYTFLCIPERLWSLWSK